MSKRAFYNFSGDFQKALLQALGLDNVGVTELILRMRVGEPVEIEVKGFPKLTGSKDLADILRNAIKDDLE